LLLYFPPPKSYLKSHLDKLAWEHFRQYQVTKSNLVC